MPTTIKVEFFYDPESNNWGFSSDSPSIIGGGDRTAERAVHHFARVLGDVLRWEEEERAEGQAAEASEERRAVATSNR